MFYSSFAVVVSSFILASIIPPANAATVAPPQPYGAIPTPQHMAWQKNEIIAFVHFNMNTFTGREWGEGKEDTATFNPTSLDCNQWVKSINQCGAKLIILTAKHHDGFCLWPSAYTEHSVKNSPWKNGKGDVVREFTDACKLQGVKAGVYLSPWDRNSAFYGDSPKYNQYYVNQLTELLTKYGPMAEVWMDGANGEGPNGKKQEYDFPTFSALVHKLAPNAVLFQGDSDNCPCIRWVGNEAGIAQATNWLTVTRGGKTWLPNETDVSIRPGWFYHTEEDSKVKTLEDLLNIYYASVGHGSVLLLNVPPDRRGLIADPDVKRLGEFGAALKTIFANDLAGGKPVTATNVRGKSATYSANILTSAKANRYWTTDDDVHTASLTIDLKKPTAFNNIVLQEYIPLGQRIAAFNVEGFIDGKWKRIGKGTTIGYKRILWIPRVTATMIRVNITDADACPRLTRIGLYNSQYDVKLEPSSLLEGKPATASSVHGNSTEYGGDKAVDGDISSRWATNDGTTDCWLEVDTLEPVTIGNIKIREFEPRITRFQLEYKLTEAEDWKIAFEGKNAGTDYSVNFTPVKARFVRLHILDSTNSPTIWEFQAYEK